MQKASSANPNSGGCLTIFGAPFAVAGILVTKQLIAELSSPGLNWNRLASLSITALMALGVGVGLMVAGLLGSKKNRAMDALQAQNPEAPWMWRPDWAQGRVESRLKNTAAAAWAIALFWTAITAPITYVAYKTWAEQVRKDASLAWVVLFPVVGICLLIWAIRATLRGIEFGKGCFLMSPVPANVGGRLQGAIQARFPNGASHGIELKLSCVNRIVTGSGKNRSAQEKILWRDEQLVPQGGIQPGPEGALIPVDFTVPADGLGTESSDPDNAIFWRLDVHADEPGVDYRDSFDVPVFRTGTSPNRERTIDRSVAFPTIPSGPPQRPPEAKVVVRPTPGGGVEFDFIAGRNPGAALGASVFFLLWTGVIIFLWTHAPLFFTIVFGLFDLLMMYIVLSLWLGASVVQIESGKISTRSGIFGRSGPVTLQCSEIADITLRIGMQTGSASGTPYYDLELLCHSGRKIVAGQGVRSKLEAEWLVSEMKKALAVQPKTFGAAAGS